ncbi:MAG: hypothetical protein ACI9XO_004928 [Paraglaciecola sp.]|jgi:hypothetical protein
MLAKKLIDARTFLHQEHKDWMSKLNFYQDEIKFFQNELVLVLTKNSDNFSTIEHVAEYRDIFLKKLTLIDNLRYEIMGHERHLADNIPTKMDFLSVHPLIRKSFNEFEVAHATLKDNFRGFAAHND